MGHAHRCNFNRAINIFGNLHGFYKSNFFYPSTIFVETKCLSTYASVKLKAEKDINKLKYIKNKVKIVRIPRINTKQRETQIECVELIKKDNKK